MAQEIKHPNFLFFEQVKNMQTEEFFQRIKETKEMTRKRVQKIPNLDQ